MSYEFEDVGFEVILNEEDFPKLIQELEETKGTAWLPSELYTEKEGYADIVYEDDFDKDSIPNMCYLKIKHRGCFKWTNIKEWLGIFNKYCIGDMYFTGDCGESVCVTFKKESDFEIVVEEYRVIPEKEWNDAFKRNYYD